MKTNINKIQVVAKAGLSMEQIESKLRETCDGIELQLLGELFKGGKREEIGRYESVIDITKLDGIHITSVHMPIFPKVGDIALEFCLKDSDYVLLCEVLRLAQDIAERQKHRVKLIIHSETYYRKCVDEDIWDDLCNMVSMLLNTYNLVDMCIENVSLIRGLSMGTLHVSNNFQFDNVEMVQRLREQTGLCQIYTCLDTCHALITIQFMNKLLEVWQDLLHQPLSLREYFEKNKEYVAIIHLAGIKGSGYGKGKHGVGFEDNPDGLMEILKYYDEFEYTCPIVIEMAEEDYTDCKVYRRNLEMLKEYYGELS